MNRMLKAWMPMLMIAALAVPVAEAASREQLDAEVREAVKELYEHSSAARELAAKAAGMLAAPPRPCAAPTNVPRAPLPSP